MHYIEHYGKDAMLQKLQQLQQQHGERFKPDAGWV